MGKPVAISESMITDKSLKRLSMISDWKSLSVEERIDRAMNELGISSEWRRAVARGANRLTCARFATLVAEAKERATSSKPRYFIKSISRELSTNR